jgi:hypothetical protein
MAQPVFLSRGDGRFTATEVARGPWDPNAQHGGAPAALLMRAFEGLPAPEGLMIARVTYEFMRPVPLGELDVRAEVVRAGRRAQLLEGSILRPDGAEVVRARAVQVQRADAGSAEDAEADERDGLPGGEPGQGQLDAPRLPMGADMMFFGADAMEIRFVAGTFNAPGPASAWFRLKVPLVDDEAPSPLQRLAAAGDFGNGISASLPWDQWIFINPDLTLYVERLPEGDWVCLESRTRIAAGGGGLAESVLYDRRGRLGRAVQALLVARR